MATNFVQANVNRDASRAAQWRRWQSDAEASWKSNPNLSRQAGAKLVQRRLQLSEQAGSITRGSANSGSGIRPSRSVLARILNRQNRYAAPVSVCSNNDAGAHRPNGVVKPISRKKVALSYQRQRGSGAGLVLHGRLRETTCDRAARPHRGREIGCTNAQEAPGGGRGYTRAWRRRRVLKPRSLVLPQPPRRRKHKEQDSLP